ncbi:type I TA system toxin YonT [Bacillus sp. EU55]
MLEKVGIAIAFLIPITVLIINCLTIVEKFQNIKKNKKGERDRQKK